MEYGLDLHGTMLLEDYRDRLPVYSLLQRVVMENLGNMVKQAGLELNAMESRIKTEKSLAGKLALKGAKYQTINNITDIFGARIITFYNEDVDRIASMAEALFDVDWNNSIDKRRMHQVNSFGYNSLHYICRLPKSLYFNEEHPELNEIPFEIQMRTALQHVWSAIQHDIGYKTDVEIPFEYHRNLSRLAGLLELADNEFSRLRSDIADYRRRMLGMVQSGKLEEVRLDGDTFHTFMDLLPFDKLNKKIAAITNAELQEANPIRYLKLLRQMGMETLADVEKLIRENSNDAYQLALFQLGSTDIDILSSNIGLQNLCIVQILKTNGGKEGIKRMFDIINGITPHNEDMAQIIMDQAAKLSFMNKKS
jgi:ppGpp synthetase/RelA/SpoT-type nucleotidyltranferase